MNSEKQHLSLHNHHHHHHHHHVFHISPLCPHHRPILQPNNHSHSSCSFSNSHNKTLPVLPNLSFHNDASMVLNESAELEVEDELDEEPTFVLTDEWREFFAKSEAKRSLAKKQAKKKNKNKNKN